MNPVVPHLKARWKPGMVYAVPLEDGSFGLAQAIDAMAVNIIYVGVFSDRFPSLPPSPPGLSPSSAVALLATWRQALNRGEWSSLGVAAPAFKKGHFPNERFSAKGFVGAKHYSAGLIAEFLSAYHGLLPWNVMSQENYYDAMLKPGVSPAEAVVLSPGERLAYRKQHFGLGA
jgi:hypothetical protein